MKILISPAKSLDFETNVETSFSSKPIFADQAHQINDVIKNVSVPDLSSLMSISPKLSELNWSRNQDFKNNTSKEKEAVFAFNGDVYDGIDAKSLSSDNVNNLQNQLRILSGLYGILKPLDIIEPYRLEMGTKMKTNQGKNLYEFWGTKISKQLNEDLSNHQSKHIINCASDEYFKVIDLQTLNAPVVKPIFKDVKNGVPKVISFFAKRARGMMSKYIIKNRVQSIEDLHSFNDNGYEFQPDQSDNHELVYIRG